MEGEKSKKKSGFWCAFGSDFTVARVEGMIVIFSGKKSTWTRGGISVEGQFFFCGGTSARKRHTTTDWSTIFAGPFFDNASDRATSIAFARRRKEQKHHLIRIRISSSFKGQASGAESVQAG